MSSSSQTFDYCILGAGIAGLSLADVLSGRSVKVCVVDTGQIASGASGTPLGMVNVATGRRATKTWRAEQCYRSILENLEKTAAYSKQPFFKKNGILRPALTRKIALKMREQLKKTSWPEGWIQWLSEEEIKEKHPGINCVDGGIWLPIGITVDVTGYLNALALYLKKRQVTIRTGLQYKINRKNGRWLIDSENVRFRAEKLIFATGYATISHPWWQHLPLHPIKGQIAVFEPDKPLGFDHSVSSLGYIARLTDLEFVQGSTYEHDFESLEPDSSGEQYLRNRLKRTLPGLEENARLKYQWAGVRMSTPNKKPVAGKHPEIENLYLFTGLGSKGLLFGGYVSECFADYLEEEKPLPKSISITRFTSINNRS